MRSVEKYVEPSCAATMRLLLRRTLVRMGILLSSKWAQKQKAIVTICALIALCFNAAAQQATWIWYPGDYEIWLSNNQYSKNVK